MATLHLICGLPGAGQTTLAILTERLAARRTNTPANTFTVTPAQLAEWGALFQLPGPDELIPRPAPKGGWHGNHEQRDEVPDQS